MPVLVPLGMFHSAPGKLRLIDVRLVVSRRDFAAYLAFFSQQLDATLLTAGGGSITMYTVRLDWGCRAAPSRWLQPTAVVCCTRCACGR